MFVKLNVEVLNHKKMKLLMFLSNLISLLLISLLFFVPVFITESGNKFSYFSDLKNCIPLIIEIINSKAYINLLTLFPTVIFSFIIACSLLAYLIRTISSLITLLKRNVRAKKLYRQSKKIKFAKSDIFILFRPILITIVLVLINKSPFVSTALSYIGLNRYFQFNMFPIIVVGILYIAIIVLYILMKSFYNKENNEYIKE